MIWFGTKLSRPQNKIGLTMEFPTKSGHGVKG
jgi:hypothetical protein